MYVCTVEVSELTEGNLFRNSDSSWSVWVGMACGVFDGSRAGKFTARWSVFGETQLKPLLTIRGTQLEVFEEPV